MKKFLSVLLSAAMLVSMLAGIAFAEEWHAGIKANEFINEIDCNNDTENGYVYFYNGNDPQYKLTFPEDGYYKMTVQYRMNNADDPAEKSIIVSGGCSGSGTIVKTTDEEGFEHTESFTVTAAAGEQTFTVSGLNGVSVVGFELEFTKHLYRFSVNAWEPSSGNNGYYIEQTDGFEYIAMFGGGEVSYSLNVPASGIYSVSGICCISDAASNPEGAFTVMSGASLAAAHTANLSGEMLYEENMAEIYLEKGDGTVTVKNAGGIKFRTLTFEMTAAGISIDPAAYRDASSGTAAKKDGYINCRNDIWLEYDFAAEESGIYDLYIANASAYTGYTIRAFIDGAAYDTADIDGTGWGKYQNSLIARAEIAKGNHVLAIQTTAECDINSIMLRQNESEKITSYKLEAENYMESSGVYRYISPDDNGNLYYNIWSNGGGIAPYNEGRAVYELTLPAYGRYTAELAYGSSADYPIEIYANGEKMAERTLAKTNGNWDIAKIDCGSVTGKNVKFEIKWAKTDDAEIQILIDYVVFRLAEELDAPDIANPLIPYSVDGADVINGYGEVTVGKFTDAIFCPNGETLTVLGTDGAAADGAARVEKGMKLCAVSRGGTKTRIYLIGCPYYNILEPEFVVTGGEDASVEGRVKILNYSPTDENLTLYVCRYDGGRLAAAAKDSASLSAAGEIVLNAAIAPASGDNACFKIYVWNDEMQPVKKAEYADTALRSRKILFLGDSITGNYDPGYEQKINLLTGALSQNGAIGGATWAHNSASGSQNDILSVADVIDGLTDAKYDWSKAEEYGEWVKNPDNTEYPNEIIAKRIALLKETDLSQYDFVSIWAGTNDFGTNVVLKNYENPDDITTTYGAVRYSLAKLTAAYPNLRIAVLLPMFRGDMQQNLPGSTLADYSNVIKAAAEGFDNVRVFDMNEISGINEYNQSSYLLGDKLHPMYDTAQASTLGLLGARIAGCLAKMN